MNNNYAIATFCFGDRYYEQTKRMIESFDYLSSKPKIFVITDKPEKIIERDFVIAKNVSEYNAKYLEYSKDYYSFDFSVKRFALLLAFENGYENVILTDTDIIINKDLYTHERILECFIPNTIAGQVTYNFSDEIFKNSELGKRFVHYELKFDVAYKKSLLDFMPEDCVQFISIQGTKRFDFIETWNKCITIKKNDGLRNTPAGNIDEMCFSALYNGLNVGNNSHKHINLMIPKHDKWY